LDAGVDASKNPPFWTDATKIREEPLQQAGPAAKASGGGAEQPLDPAVEKRGQFASVVLADTEDVWNRLFAEKGQKYSPPKMVLFSGQVQSACGFAEATSGPFYCPGDQKLYLDTTFFRQLDQQLDAPGDFAQAYVIAHEVGHHIQNLEGTTDKLDQIRRRVSPEQYNEYSVRLELQADFTRVFVCTMLRG